MDKSTEKGVDNNLMAAAAYFFSIIFSVFGIIFGAALYFMAPKDKFVRFHAIQSILLNILIGILFVVLLILAVLVYFAFDWLKVPTIFTWIIIVLGWGIFSLLAFILWLFLLYKAYKGECYGLPFIGGLAEKYS